MIINPILENIHKALGKKGSVEPGPRPEIYPARKADSNEAEIERFMKEVRLLKGTAEKMNQAEIVAHIVQLVKEDSIRKATMWQTPFLQEVGVEATLHEHGVEIVPAHAEKHEMALCDLGVTEADFLLPETGTLALTSSAQKPRAVSLLPRIHLAIVRPDLLRADMHQIFGEARNEYYLVFVTGPSRTADIELTVALGVHGPKSLFVWVVER